MKFAAMRFAIYKVLRAVRCFVKNIAMVVCLCGGGGITQEGKKFKAVCRWCLQIETYDRECVLVPSLSRCSPARHEMGIAFHVVSVASSRAVPTGHL